jgi:hypothetical protein
MGLGPFSPDQNKNNYHTNSKENSMFEKLKFSQLVEKLPAACVNQFTIAFNTARQKFGAASDECSSRQAIHIA